MVTSLLLLVIVIWMLYDSQSKASVTSSSVLELMWISAHSMALQDLMKMTSNSSPDYLRPKGMKAQVNLADLVSEPTRCPMDKDNNSQPDFKVYAPNWQVFTTEGLYPQFNIKQTADQW